ncbi:MAG: hypothetical protein RIA63_06565, partial [Cyclobacteriaceae bacterium]
MEVSRILLNGHIRDKVYFVTRHDPSEPDLFRLSKYGSVLPIGVQGFAQEILSRGRVLQPDQPSYLTALRKLELPSLDDDHSDARVRNFLLDGNVDLGYIVNAITSESGRYLALRKSAECAPRVLKDTAGLVLHSGLANGKTVALQEIASHLLLLDRSVYVLDDEDGNYESDIEKLSELKEIAYLIVDDCERYSDLIKYFLSVLGPRGRVVASERSHRLAKGIEPFDALDLQIAINSVDYLEETERTGLIKVLDTAGLWGTLAGKSRKAKEDYIEVTCESQISAILLDILEAPQIKNVVLSEFQKVSKDERVKRTIYTICIIQSVGAGKVTKSLISEVEDSLDVYSKEVSDALAGSGMFGRSDGNTLETRSSIFGTFLMREAFTPSYA